MLYIFDTSDQLLTILDNSTEDACPYWNAMFEEELNKGSAFEFTVPADHPDAEHAIAENQVAFKDKDGAFRLFVIRELEEIDGDSLEKRAICEPAMLELNDEPLEDLRPNNQTAQYVLDQILLNTRWKSGTVASLGSFSTNFYYESVISGIENILNIWGGELRDRVEIVDNKITGRYIDILARRGADTGKRWEIDKDIVSITRTVLSYPKTALYGRGKGEQTGDGYGRRLTFADVSWSTANGDPVDKPLGQEWVGDPDALNQYGRPNPDQTLRHRFGFAEFSDEEDPATLLQLTWDDLQEKKEPVVNYAMSVNTLEDVSGYEHEKARLGDTTAAIDRNFKTELILEARVIKFKYDVADPDGNADVELGNFLPMFTDDKRLDQIEAKLNNRSGIWDSVTEPTTDTSFPDNVPPVPANFTAVGLFKMIQLDWDFDASSYIASYEIYASQVLGFAPDASNLVFRGKVGGYAFDAAVNQQWYFRARAVNTHGTASGYTAEITATTVTINADTEVTPLTITNQLIAETAAIDWAKIANVQVTNAQIANLAVDDAKIKNVSAEKISAETLSAISANLGTVTAGDISGVKIRSDSTDSEILIVDGYILNAYDVDNPTSSARTYIQDGYVLVRQSGDQEYTTYDTHFISHQDLRTSGNSPFNIRSNIGITLDGASSGVRIRGYNHTDTNEVDVLYDHANGNVSLSAAGGDLNLGYWNTVDIRAMKDLIVGNKTRLQASDTHFRIYAPLSTSNQIRLAADGQVAFYSGGVARHIFEIDGSKTGGSFEFSDGTVLGMSPIDSPQVLLEYVEFHIPLTVEGTKVFLDSRFREAVEHFDVDLFSKKAEVIEKGFDYFVVTGEGTTSARIIGERTGYAGVFWNDMSVESAGDAV